MEESVLGEGEYTLRRGEFSAILSDSCSYMFLLCFFDLKLKNVFLNEKVSPNRATEIVSRPEFGEFKIHVLARFSQLLDLPGLKKQGFINDLLLFPAPGVRDGDCVLGVCV